MSSVQQPSEPSPGDSGAPISLNQPSRPPTVKATPDLAVGMPPAPERAPSTPVTPAQKFCDVMRAERVPMRFLPFEKGPYMTFEDAVQAIQDRPLRLDLVKQLSALERFEMYPICSRTQEVTTSTGEKKLREKLVMVMRTHQRNSKEPQSASAIAMMLNDTWLKVIQNQAPGLRLDRIEVLMADHQLFDDLRKAATDSTFRDKVLGRLNPEASAAKALEQLFRTGIQEGASDIHIQTLESGDSRVRYRINGVLQERYTLPHKTARPLVAQLKNRGNMKLDEHRRPLDGRIFFTDADVKAEPILNGWSVRVSIVVGQGGPTAVMRLLKSASETDFQLERLGLTQHILTGIDNVLQTPNGIVLVTGPTGSGKTSTLYSIIKKLDDGETNILTVEDPVEVALSGITQVQVNRSLEGLGFPDVLRAFLRQDPDVILVGEIRDAETAEIAVQAALTGHLVLATVHTNDSFGTLQRLKSLGIDNSKLQDTIRAVLSQRLVRRLCCDCREKYDAAPDLNKFLGPNADGSPAFVAPLTLYRAGGKTPTGAPCKPCKGTGYDGRFPVAELWVPGGEEKAMIITDTAHPESLYQSAVTRGMIPMLNAAMEDIQRGRTSLGECLSRAFSVDDLRTRREAVIRILRGAQLH